MSFLFNSQSASDTVETTDATPTTIATFSMGERTAGVVRARVIAREDASDVAKAWAGSFAFRHDAGGPVKIIDTDVTVLADLSPGALVWTVAVNISGTDIVLQVKGGAGQTISWAIAHSLEWIEEI